MISIDITKRNHGYLDIDIYYYFKGNIEQIIKVFPNGIETGNVKNICLKNEEIYIRYRDESCLTRINANGEFNNGIIRTNFKIENEIQFNKIIVSTVMDFPNNLYQIILTKNKLLRPETEIKTREDLKEFIEREIIVTDIEIAHKKAIKEEEERIRWKKSIEQMKIENHKTTKVTAVQKIKYKIDEFKRKIIIKKLTNDFDKLLKKNK